MNIDNDIVETAAAIEKRWVHGGHRGPLAQDIAKALQTERSISLGFGDAVKHWHERADKAERELAEARGHARILADYALVWHDVEDESNAFIARAKASMEVARKWPISALHAPPKEPE